ncbi:MAG: winged helix-turn-helix domain-containing protein [Firmicutes bacterium]|nr:winged helix-turn-helix domain-containing protein [Bacillota bacterium]
MGRKMLEVKSLYELTIDDLNLIASNANSNYTSDVVKAIIMRYNDVPMQVIANTLGKCRATVISYINAWNKLGVASIVDQRGGSVPDALTDDIVEDIRDVITTKKPSDFDYECNKWSCALLTRYIEENYGKKYSDEWVRLLLKKLGFTYKRGVFKPSLANPELQESFKKNGYPIGCY